MIQFRHYVRAAGDETIPTPKDIIIETLLALLLCTVGASWWANRFKPILAAPTYWNRRYDEFGSLDDFQTFNHRGRAFAAWKVWGQQDDDAATTTRSAAVSEQRMGDERKED